MAKKLFGQLGRLKRDKVEEYVRLHSKPWPEVLDMIKACKLSNYSIFLHGDMVFAYYEYEGDDFERDMQKMSDDLKTQKWWTLTHPCFEEYAIDKNSQFYHDMEQIFYLD